MPAVSSSAILDKIESGRDIPTIPDVLIPLLRCMERPVDRVDMHEVVALISQDKALAGRCLQLANSPLFGSSREIETIQSAVVSLGLERIQQIAVSCSLLRLMPGVSLGVNPSVFWAHSLACAMIAQELALKIGFPEPTKAYAAGLLHDIGLVAMLWVAPHDFRRCYEEARHNHIPVHEAEERLLGVTHCECGRIIAGKWHLSEELTDAIACHHAPARSAGNHGLTCIVCASDLLCRTNGLGYGYKENCAHPDEQAAFATLAHKYPALRPFEFSRLLLDEHDVFAEVHTLVWQIYGH
ncbi:MAG TPA: HDOD domain-containing protein [Terriglobales bacterium]|jgi:HD-like signal output (HDOD) protein